MLELSLSTGPRDAAVSLHMCTISEQGFGSEARPDYLCGTVEFQPGEHSGNCERCSYLLY